MAKLSEIKALNENGIKLFHNLINARRAGKDFPVSEILSNSHNYVATPFKTEIELDREFKDRYEMAQYLNGVLEEYDDNIRDYGKENQSEDGLSAGLWSWFALVYFDQLTEKKPNKEHEHYIFAPDLGQRFYRHCVFTPFDIYKRWGEVSRVFISEKITVMGQVWESALSRNFIKVSSPAMRLIHKLYADPENKNIAKSGASSQPSKKILKTGKPSKAGHGGIERFANVFDRLRLTYHVQSLDEDSLLELMGDEFNKWIEKT